MALFHGPIALRAGVNVGPIEVRATRNRRGRLAYTAECTARSCRWTADADSDREIADAVYSHRCPYRFSEFGDFPDPL